MCGWMSGALLQDLDLTTAFRAYSLHHDLHGRRCRPRRDRAIGGCVHDTDMKIDTDMYGALRVEHGLHGFSGT
jgi:hypothetical protein